MTHTPSQMPDEIYGWEYGGRHYAEKPPVDPDSWTFIKYIRADLASTPAASAPDQSETIKALVEALEYYKDARYVDTDGDTHDDGEKAREALIAKAK